jgi:hypothetical protein
MAIFKSIATLAACGAATVNAAAVQPRQYKTVVSSVRFFLCQYYGQMY